MLMRISTWIYNCSSRYTFQIIIPKVCLLPPLLLLSSHSCPTKIELQEGRRGFHVLGSSPGLSREARFHEHGLGARVYPWITRRCTNSPDFFLLLPLLPFLPVDLRFHLGPLFLPPRPSLSLSLLPSIPRSAPAKTLLRVLSLSLSLLGPPAVPPFLRLGPSARSGHWSCYNPESADGRPMYGSLFYAGCAALRCTPRRARARAAARALRIETREDVSTSHLATPRF